jgi:hypothetical protein
MNKIRAFFVAFIVAVFLFNSHAAVSGQSASNTQAGFFTDVTAAPNVRIEVPLEIRNVQELYALDLSIKFDPAILTVEDADPSSSGVQVALGQFLDPGMVLFNTVDNQKGAIHFVMTQINPSEPKSGSGNLLVIYFKGLKEGSSDLSFTNIQFSDRNGIQINASEVDAVITIKQGVPTVAATSIPVQDAARLTQIPTMMPTSATPTPIPTPAPTLAPTVSSEIMPTAVQASLPNSVTADSEAQTSLQIAQLFLLQNWWIVLVLLIVVAALAVYLIVTKQRKAGKE